MQALVGTKAMGGQRDHFGIVSIDPKERSREFSTGVGGTTSLCIHAKQGWPRTEHGRKEIVALLKSHGVSEKFRDKDGG